MSTSKEYYNYIEEQLSHLGDISYRAMMGEYIIYYHGKVVGGIYDDRLLIKVTEGAKKVLGDVSYEIPYDGAKPMLLVDDIENQEKMKELFDVTYIELPEKKK